MYVCVCVCIYIYIYIYIYMHVQDGVVGQSAMKLSVKKVISVCVCVYACVCFMHACSRRCGWPISYEAVCQEGDLSVS